MIAIGSEKKGFFPLDGSGSVSTRRRLLGWDAPLIVFFSSSFFFFLGFSNVTQHLRRFTSLSYPVLLVERTQTQVLCFFGARTKMIQARVARFLKANTHLRYRGCILM